MAQEPETPLITRAHRMAYTGDFDEVDDARADAKTKTIQSWVIQINLSQIRAELTGWSEVDFLDDWFD